ncbi:hypothetical protein YC2023_011186 [Brassica napus]
MDPIASKYRLYNFISVCFFADHVFDERSKNASVYELLTKDIIHAAVQGFNETDPGITRKSVRDVFDRIQMVGGIKIYWISVKLPQEYNF